MGPTTEEADNLSQPLRKFWTDGLPAYQGMEHDHRTVIHDKGDPSEDGVHSNNAECLQSLITAMISEVPRPAKQDEERAARTYDRIVPRSNPSFS